MIKKGCFGESAWFCNLISDSDAIRLDAMLFSAAGVAFTPTLRPHVAQHTARAAVVCGLEAPVPPAAVVILEAATRQARQL